MVSCIRSLCLASGGADLMDSMHLNFDRFRNRLESNAEQWTQLQLILQELVTWTNHKSEQKHPPIGGDLPSITKQVEDHKVRNLIN